MLNGKKVKLVNKTDFGTIAHTSMKIGDHYVITHDHTDFHGLVSVDAVGGCTGSLKGFSDEDDPNYILVDNAS